MKSLEKYIKEIEYNLLLDWKIEIIKKTKLYFQIIVVVKDSGYFFYIEYNLNF